MLPVQGVLVAKASSGLAVVAITMVAVVGLPVSEIPKEMVADPSTDGTQGRTGAVPDSMHVAAWTAQMALLNRQLPATCEPIRHFRSMTELATWARAAPVSTYSTLFVDFNADSALRFSGLANPYTIATADATVSLTNNQVAGVDEADFVKTDGQMLYARSGGSIVVAVVAPVDKAQVLERLPYRGSLAGLLIDEEHLVVITTESRRSFLGAVWWDWDEWYPSESGLLIRVYDRTWTPLRLEREIALNGTYLGARTIGDHLFVISDFALRKSNETIILPTLRVDGLNRTLAPADVGYLETSWNASRLLTLLKMNLSSSDGPALTSLLADSGATLYVSPSNLYLAGTHYRGYNGGWQTTMSVQWQTTTIIHKIPLRRAPAECAASTQIPGRVYGQFAMDEFDGNLRVATTAGNTARSGGTASNAVYVLSENLTRLGWIEGLAPGEQIHSARFMGERLYLVTFKKVDPLFVIDLAVPTRPAVLGYLKIPGFSDYLHPVGPGLLIGVGLETVESTTGGFSWFQGVKLSLFDVSDFANPAEVAKLVIGDRGSWTPVTQDHRAFTWIAEHSLLVLPVHVFDVNETRAGTTLSARTFGEEVWQGAYVIEVSAESGFRIVERITHHDASEYATCETYIYRRSESITRSFEVGGYVYTVSEESLQAHAGSDWFRVLNLNLWDGPVPTTTCPGLRPPRNFD